MILAEIVAGGDTAEKHYLEVKRDLDFSSREEVTKVAKFILGAANRLPSVASRSLGGYAVMVVGAEQGGLPGVLAGTEILDIEQKLEKFLQPEGPIWDLEREPADDPEREVLFILVDPPRDGDPIYVCRADYQAAKPKGAEIPKGTNLADGEIYIRVQGQTRKAKSSEVHALVARAGGGINAAPELNVRLQGEASRLEDSSEALNSFLAGRIAQAQSKHVKAGSSGDSSWGMSLVAPSHPLLTRTSWSQESFDSRASEWERDVREQWQESVEKVASAVLPRLTISLGNLQAGFLENVRLDLTLEGAQGTEALEPEGINLDRIFPPVIDKEDPHGFIAAARNNFDAFHYRVPRPSPLEWKNVGDDLHITVELDSLRPGTPWVSENDELVVIAHASGSDALSGTWKATVRGHHELYEGTISLPIGEPRSFLSLIADLKNRTT